MLEYAISRLQWLRGQLAAGWRLEAPVIERPIYRGAVAQTSAFEFVLRDERGCQAVAVVDCPEVRLFLKERGLERVSL